MNSRIYKKTLFSERTKIKAWVGADIPIKNVEQGQKIENHDGAKVSAGKLQMVLNKSYMLEIKANGKTLICNPDALLLGKVTSDMNAWIVADDFTVGDTVVMANGEFPIDSIQVLFYSCSQMIYGLSVVMSKSFVANDFCVRNY